jgi:hypothetical protein
MSEETIEKTAKPEKAEKAEKPVAEAAPSKDGEAKAGPNGLIGELVSVVHRPSAAPTAPALHVLQ